MKSALHAQLARRPCLSCWVPKHLPAYSTLPSFTLANVGRGNCVLGKNSLQLSRVSMCMCVQAEREPVGSSSPDYDSTKVAAYASSRMPACYAVLYRVFDELHLHLPAFCPKTMLDFGSGPGTAIWAAREVRRFVPFCCNGLMCCKNKPDWREKTCPAPTLARVTVIIYYVDLIFTS